MHAGFSVSQLPISFSSCSSRLLFGAKSYLPTPPRGIERSSSVSRAALAASLGSTTPELAASSPRIATLGFAHATEPHTASSSATSDNLENKRRRGMARGGSIHSHPAGRATPNGPAPYQSKRRVAPPPEVDTTGVTVSSRRAFVLSPPATGRSFPLELLTNETTAMVASTPAPTAVPIVTPRRSAPFSHRQCVSVERHEYSN